MSRSHIRSSLMTVNDCMASRETKIKGKSNILSFNYFYFYVYLNFNYLRYINSQTPAWETLV